MWMNKWKISSHGISANGLDIVEDNHVEFLYRIPNILNNGLIANTLYLTHTIEIVVLK